MEHLRSIPEFQKIAFVRGDYVDETVLLRANVTQASKVLVLAESGNLEEVAE